MHNIDLRPVYRERSWFEDDTTSYHESGDYLVTYDVDGFIMPRYRSVVASRLQVLRFELLFDLQSATSIRPIAIHHGEIKDNIEAAISKRARLFSPRAVVVSLDDFLYYPEQAQRTIDVSRYTNINGETIIGQGPRPGALPLESQILQLANLQEIILVDSGSFTGEQLETIAKMIRPIGVKVSATVLGIITKEARNLLAINFLHPSAVHSFDFLRDWIEERDFYPGIGGIVVADPHREIPEPMWFLNLPVRKPYLMPFISPHERASIPAYQEKWFSRRQLLRAITLYETLGKAAGYEITFANLGSVIIKPSFPHSNQAELSANPTTRLVDFLKTALDLIN